jgi:surface antigen
MRIIVNPDQLRLAAQQLHRAHSDLQNQNNRVGSTLGRLDWEARQAAGVERQVSQAQSMARTLASQAEELACYLERTAQRFEEADSAGAAGLSGLSGGMRNLVKDLTRNPGFWGIIGGGGLGILGPGSILGPSLPGRKGNPFVPVPAMPNRFEPANGDGSRPERSWADRLERRKFLEEQIAALEADLVDDATVEGMNRRIEEIDSRIQEIDARRDELQKKIGDWRNHLPGFGQGDEYYEEFVELGKERAELYDERNQLYQQNEQQNEKLEEIRRLNEQVKDLRLQPGDTLESTTSAEDVPAEIDDTVGYPRRGFDAYGDPYSNCTWYATAAVKAESGGAIDLDDTGKFGNLGDATTWADRAEAYAMKHPDGSVVGVDRSPQAGDVLWKETGHVAFVEEVKLSDDGTRLEITYSEESANGLSNGQPVTVKDDLQNLVKRWRVVKSFDIVPGSDPPTIKAPADCDVKFIHFRYDQD